MTKMKLCPFCKSTDTRIAEFVSGWSYYNSITYNVCCNNCGCYGPKSKSVDDNEGSDEEKFKMKELAIKLWNKRYLLTK
jgi:C4-type Zn-finger protein